MSLRVRSTRSKKMKRVAIISMLTLTSLETHTKIWKDRTNEKKSKVWRGGTNKKKSRVWKSRTNKKKTRTWRVRINKKPTILRQATSDLQHVQKIVKQTGQPPTGQCLDSRHDKDIGKIILTRAFNAKCRKFIKNDGSYGPWGADIENYILQNHKIKTAFFHQKILGMQSAPKTCPNWKILSEQEKLKFWVWTFAAIAQDESSCNPEVVNQGTKKHPIPDKSDPPTGLFQLNALYKERYWRSGKQERECKFPSGKTKPVKEHIHCSLRIMYDLIKLPPGQKPYRPKIGGIFPTNSYWENLRGTSNKKVQSKLRKNIRRYTPCGAKH